MENFFVHQGMEIPGYMLDGINRYVTHKIEPGDFLRNVLCNDLRGAADRADSTNFPLLGTYVAYLYNHVPANVWGSVEAYNQHLKVEETPEVEPEMILIKKNEDDEYEVPCGLNSKGMPEIYFTDDREDAEATAKRHHGDNAEMRHEHGSYNVNWD